MVYTGGVTAGFIQHAVVWLFLCSLAACNSTSGGAKDGDSGVEEEENAWADDGGWLDADPGPAGDDAQEEDGPVDDGVDGAESEPDAFSDDAGEADGDGGDAPADGDGARPEFLVLTINLKHPLTGLDEAHQRLQMVADLINARQPDVVALQEVIKPDNEPSFAEQLATLTGYGWHWEFAYNVPMLFDEGLGVLSRWPVLWHESRELPHLDLVLFTRRVLGARVAWAHGEIQLFCTHMTTDSDEGKKADQALTIFQFIAEHPTPLPGFLAGDMNAEPDTLAMRFFRGEAEHQAVTSDLIDSWLVANPGDPGYTMESYNPHKRIDYIYLVPGSEVSAEPLDCELVFTEPVGGVYASDHLGILCRFALSTP